MGRASSNEELDQPFWLTTLISCVLIVLGVLLAVYAGVIQADLRAESTCVLAGYDVNDTPTRHEDEPQGALSPTSVKHTDCTTGRDLPPGLHTERLTITRRNPSDTLVEWLVATAVVLVLAGAFYTRVEKLRWPGGGIDLRKQKRLDKRRARKAAKDRAARERRAPEVAKAAEDIAQQEAVEVIDFAHGRRSYSPISIEPERLEELRQGNPLPSDLLQRLAEDAIRKAEEQTRASSPDDSTPDTQA